MIVSKTLTPQLDLEYYLSQPTAVKDFMIHRNKSRDLHRALPQ
jgi:hypothetical protein